MIIYEKLWEKMKEEMLVSIGFKKKEPVILRLQG